MKTLSSDTDPDVERFQIELIRKASISQRLQIVASLIKTTHRLSWIGLCKRYPNETVEACMEHFISYLYGDKFLANQVMAHIGRKGT